MSSSAARVSGTKPAEKPELTIDDLIATPADRILYFGEVAHPHNARRDSKSYVICTTDFEILRCQHVMYHSDSQRWSPHYESDPENVQDYRREKDAFVKAEADGENFKKMLLQTEGFFGATSWSTSDADRQHYCINDGAVAYYQPQKEDQGLVLHREGSFIVLAMRDGAAEIEKNSARYEGANISFADYVGALLDRKREPKVRWTTLDEEQWAKGIVADDRSLASGAQRVFYARQYAAASRILDAAHEIVDAGTAVPSLGARQALLARVRQATP